MSGPAFDLEERKRLWKLPSISSQLPVLFNNENKISTFTGECPECNCQIFDQNLHGDIQLFNGNKTADIRALGHCEGCNLVTCFRYRISEDVVLSGQKDGKWLSWVPKTSGYAEHSINTRAENSLGWIVGYLKTIYQCIF